MFQGKLYFALLILCWSGALLRGGQPERIGATMLAVGSCLSTAIRPRWSGSVEMVEVGILAVDIVCFAAFILLALRADRFWPIWASAFVGLGALGHLARWFAGSEISLRVYAMSVAMWSYPILALIAIGTWSYQRRTRVAIGQQTPQKGKMQSRSSARS